MVVFKRGQGKPPRSSLVCLVLSRRLSLPIIVSDSQIGKETAGRADERRAPHTQYTYCFSILSDAENRKRNVESATGV